MGAAAAPLQSPFPFSVPKDLEAGMFQPHSSASLRVSASPVGLRYAWEVAKDSDHQQMGRAARPRGCALQCRQCDTPVSVLMCCL